MGVGAFGTFLIWNYHKVLEILNISGPSQSRDTIDVTSHDTANGFREFIVGPIAGGEVSIEGNFVKGDANGQLKFHTDLQGGTKRSCFIALPMAVGAACSFEAFAKGFESSYPFDDKISVSGSLQVTGKPTLLTVLSDGMSAMTGIEQQGGAPLTITPAVAPGTYEYACTVNTNSTWVKLTVTATGHSLWIQGVVATSGVETGEIALGGAGTETKILLIAQQANKAPRLYTLTVTRP